MTVEYRCGECAGPLMPYTAVESFDGPSIVPEVYPGVFVWTRYASPCGHVSFVRSDRGELDLGIVRDTELNTANSLEVYP